MFDAEAAERTLRERGMRLTPQRRALIAELSDDRTHPSAEEMAARVARRVPGVSLSTVYSGLHEFAHMGLVREIDTPGAMRFDAETADHAHLACVHCGSVTDIDLTPSLTSEIASAAGIAGGPLEITVRGVCQRCTSA